MYESYSCWRDSNVSGAAAAADASLGDFSSGGGEQAEPDATATTLSPDRSPSCPELISWPDQEVLLFLSFKQCVVL